MTRALFLFALFLWLPSAFAQHTAPPYERPGFIHEAAVLPTSDGPPARRLTLQEAIRVAVAQNLGIHLTRERFRSAQLGVSAAGGRFEPSLSAAYSHNKSDSFPTTNNEGMPGVVFHAVTDAWSLAIRQPIPTGANLSLSFSNGRRRSKADDALAPTLYDSGLVLNLSQPILRGFSLDLDIPRVDILRAKLARDGAGLSLRLAIMTTVRDTENAYWDLVQALKDYQVRQLSLDSSISQQALSQRQIRAGVLAPSDLINAESTVARRRLDMVQALENVQRMSDGLRHVLNLPRELWAQPILPTDAPTYEEMHVLEQAVLTKALRLRPEISQQKVNLEQATLDVRVAKNNELPQIDLGFNYGVSGQDGTYGRAVDQALSGSAPSWTALVTVTWTPLNRVASARAEAQRVGRRIAQSQMEQRVLDLYSEVRTTVRALDTAGRQVLAAAKFRELAQRNLDVEQRKFLNGTSNNFMIEQRQESLSLAQLAELRAVIQRQKAIANLHLTQGTILGHRNIQIDDIEP